MQIVRPEKPRNMQKYVKQIYKYVKRVPVSAKSKRGDSVRTSTYVLSYINQYNVQFIILYYTYGMYVPI